MIYNECRLCPRNCGANRYTAKGYCGEGSAVRISRAALHIWEEPCISGENGSGTVFFTGCQLKCVFCQNYDIANNKKGREISVEELTKVFFDLKNKGAHNINLVTPDHFIPSVAQAIKKSKEMGIDLPFIYNCGGYTKIESLKLLDGLVDVYLPDFKYYSPLIARKYSNAYDYPKRAKECIDEMTNQAGECVFENGLIKKGVIVRHLVLPGNVPDSKKILAYLYNTYNDRIFLSIMNQYTPVNLNVRYEELKRKLTEEEYDEVLSFAEYIGIKNAYIQGEGAADSAYIPEFGF